MSKGMIVFGEDWGRHPSSTQHIVKHMAKTQTVIWVNSLGLRRPRLSFYDFKRFFKKLYDIISGYQAPQQVVPKNIHIVSPLALPFPNSALVQWLNGVIVSHQLRNAMKKTTIEQPDILISLPTALSTIKVLTANHKVYYCCDDFSALAGVDHQAIQSLENRLLNSTDNLVVVSEVLKKKFAQHKPIVIPQGVDVELFSAPTQYPKDLPAKKNIIGFCGGIEEWVDLALIKKMATTLTDHHIVLVGPIKCDVSALTECKNITLLGAKPYQEVAAYMQHWQVSILPFNVIRKEVIASDPLKIREYLAAGRPIVVTNFPVMQQFSEVVTIADSHDDFINAVASYCQGNDAIGTKKRQQWVENDSWETRAQSMQKVFTDNAITT